MMNRYFLVAFAALALVAACQKPAQETKDMQMEKRISALESLANSPKTAGVEQKNKELESAYTVCTQTASELQTANAKLMQENAELSAVVEKLRKESQEAIAKANKSEKAQKEAEERAFRCQEQLLEMDTKKNTAGVAVRRTDGKVACTHPDTGKTYILPN